MIFTREQWCRDVLNLLGNTSPSELLINFMVGWTCSETKTDSGALFNLLNSTHEAPESTDFNATGVQNYISYEQGIQMTVETLNGKYYPSLLSALKNNTITNPLSLDILANLHMWCGGCGYGENFVHLGELHRNDTFGGIMQIIPLFNNNCFKGANNPRYIILHGTAGGASALNIAQYFKGTEGGNNPTSAHYVIDQAGVIYQCNSEDDGAWANGVVSAGHDPWWNVNGNPNPNNITISIEHVKPDTANATPLTPAQQAASFALVADICERRGIPKRPADALGGVTGHFSIDPVNRARCPGPYNWDALWEHLAGNQPEDIPVTIDLTNATVASHFTGDANQWTCKDTKFTLHGEILTFYQSFGGNSLCGLTHLGLPLSAETPILGKLGTVYQRFERGVLAFDPNKLTDNPPGSGRVYLLHIDSGLGQDPRVAILQAQVDNLKNLPVVANLEQITTIGQRIRDDVDLVVKLATVI
ncbi:MAG TPA: N-acetylmuramoyl-L-alanine amidase [Ktedonobacteraceae bacterium]|nr:N-acetylmuramoyl-L-alanine amidase [Ktedonobacteraceae bacterium]